MKTKIWDISIVAVKVSDLNPNPYQPATRLQVDESTAKKFGLSILEHGLLVTPVGRQVNGVFQVGDGWLRAAGYRWLADNGHTDYLDMPMLIKDLTDRQMADMVMEANTIRKDLTAIELGQFYKRYIEDFDVTQEELARRHNCTQGEISNTIRLLELPVDIQEKVISQEISETHGRQLLRMNQLPALQQKVFANLLKRPMTVDMLSNTVNDELYWFSKDMQSSMCKFSQEAECVGCDKRRKLGWRASSNEAGWRCFDPQCFERKNAAAVKQQLLEETQRVKEIQQETGLKVLDVDKISYSSFEYLYDHNGDKRLDNPECETCEKRALVKMQYSRYSMGGPVLSCLDPECFKGKRATFEKNQAFIMLAAVKKEDEDFKAALAACDDSTMMLRLLAESMVTNMYFVVSQKINQVTDVPLGKTKRVETLSLLEHLAGLSSIDIIKLMLSIVYTEEKHYRQQKRHIEIIESLKPAPGETKPTELNTYRVWNRVKLEFADPDIEAASAQEACEKAGWLIGDCWVRRFTPKGGWANETDSGLIPKVKR